MKRLFHGEGALVAGMVLGLALALRLLALPLDPPNYARFGAAWGDEGPWAWPAAHRAVTGSWPEGGQVFVRAAPAHAWPLALAFEVLPPGLLGARFLSLLAGLGTVALLWRICRPLLGIEGAALATTLYATALWPVLYERHASPEAVGVFYAVGAVALLLDERPLARGPGALLLATLAFAAKASLVFFPVFVFAAVAVRRARHRDDTPARYRWPFAALIMIGGAAALFAVQLYQTLWFVAQVPTPSSSFVAAAAGAARRLAMAPFNADYFLSMPLAVAGLILVVARGIPDTAPARTLLLLSSAWVVCWWMVVPGFDLKGSRYYLISPPVLILATLGWLGVFHSAWHPLEGLVPKAAHHLRWAATVLALAWAAALGAIEWSIQGGPQARVSFPLLAAVSVGLGMAVMRAALRGGVPRKRPATGRLLPFLLLAVLASQVPWWWSWRNHASRMVLDAVVQMSRSPILSGSLCGDQAPLLLLGQPGHAEALYNVYWKACSRGGRVADRVVVTPEPLCAPYEGPWIQARREEFLRRSPELVLTLPGDPPAPRSCLHYVVRIGGNG